MRIWPTKRFWKRLAIGLVTLVAIALIANGFMAWRIESRLQAMIAAIRVAGDPASIAELAPTPIPDAENAAAILGKLGPRLDAFSKEYARFFDTPLGKAYDEQSDRGEAPKAEQIAAMRAILDKYSDIDAGLAAAAACDKYASLVDYSTTSVKLIEGLLKRPIARFRTAERFVDWRMETLIAERQPQKAVALGLEFLRLARLYDQEPLMVNALVNIAVRCFIANRLYDALAAGPISPELHAALDHELALQDDPQQVTRVLKTERAYSASSIVEFRTNPPPILEVNPIFSRMFGWTMQRHFLGALEFYDVLLPSASRPWYDAHQQVWRVGTPDASSFGVMAALLIPALEAFYDAEARSTAVLRALRIDNALRAFAEKNGREANGLAELTLPESATIDPYNGEPLKLKRTDDGWMVYSVMRNDVDDGGDFEAHKDYGVAPPKVRLTEKPKPPANDSAASAKQ
ncbi:MAG TPA: hypothetical protein VHU84_03925 [Lacipirellulaceae bacterium]|nr:hypothetical protein [Lacipirellulaceae bacterium]